MKTKLSFIGLVIGFCLQLLLASGCANTGKGIQKDFHHAEDKVEQVGK